MNKLSLIASEESLLFVEISMCQADGRSELKEKFD